MIRKTALALSVGLMLASAAPVQAEAEECSDGWRVTGYYTPLNKEFGGATELASIGDERFEVFTSFREVIEIEAWGQLTDGQYVGYWDGEWQMFASKPLNSRGKALSITSVAVDTSVIPHGTRLTIPELPGEYGQRVYIADDIGPSIVGKHLDIYVGEGEEAGQDMYEITGSNLVVCIQ